MNSAVNHETLQTARLTLRPLLLDDADALFAIYSNTEAMRFMPTLPHKSMDETQDYIARELGVPGSLHWTICLRDVDTPIGHVNYLGQTALPGMGYILHRDHWGRGLTTEACRVALEYGFEVRKLDRVELWINEQNFASQRVAQKLGFQLKGTLPQKYSYETAHHIMLVYGQWAHEWRGETAVTNEVPFYNAQPVLLVHDVAASVAYFQEKLGFRIDFLFGDPPNHAGVSRGDWSGRMVTLQLTNVPPERVIEPAGYIYIMVGTNIDELFEQYRDAGVEIVAEPTSQPWGMREFTVRELNGHLLRFGTHL